QELKLKETGKLPKDVDVKEYFLEYALALAETMDEWGVDHIHDQTEWGKPFFAEREEVEMARMGCPLTKMDDTRYAFLHDSLLEYFLVRAYFEKSVVLKTENFRKDRLNLTQSKKLVQEKKESSLNSKLITRKLDQVRLMADCVGSDATF